MTAAAFLMRSSFKLGKYLQGHLEDRPTPPTTPREDIQREADQFDLENAMRQERAKKIDLENALWQERAMKKASRARLKLDDVPIIKPLKAIVVPEGSQDRVDGLETKVLDLGRKLSNQQTAILQLQQKNNASDSAVKQLAARVEAIEGQQKLINNKVDGIYKRYDGGLDEIWEHVLQESNALHSRVQNIEDDINAKVINVKQLNQAVEAASTEVTQLRTSLRDNYRIHVRARWEDEPNAAEPRS